MSSEWPSVSFASAPLEIIDGDRGTNYPKQADFHDVGYCLFLNAGNVTTHGFRFSDCAFITKEKDEQLRKGKLKRHDVVLTTRGTVGNVAYFDEAVPFGNIRINSGMVVLRAATSDLSPRFLYQFLRSKEFKDQVISLTSGSAQPQLPIRDMNRIELPLPTIEEQHAIAAVIGSLDDKIELNRRLNATLEAMAQAVFKEWFVDGAKEELPDGWQRMRLAELVDTQYGYTASASTEQVGPKFLRVTDINKQNWIEWSAVPQCEVAAKDADAYKLKVGDILVARMADPGKSAIIEEDVDAVFASYLVRLKTANLAQSYFLYHYLKSPEYLEYCEGAKTGSVQLNMNAKVIVAVELTVPPQALMDRFLDVVLPLRKRIAANVNESRTLAALRDTLLPKLMRGEVRVKQEATAPQSS